MLKKACLLTGENYALLASDTPASKKKVVAMALAMMVPTLIWIFNGFMLSYQVVQAGLDWSILTAVICGMIIFMIEKLIIMANGNGWLTLFRICIGLIVALLGSIAVDEVVFEDDIDISVAQLREKEIATAKVNEEKNFNALNEVTQLNSEISIAQKSFDSAEALAVAEADGSKGTGNKGVGRVADYKDQKARQRKQDLNNLLIKKNTLFAVKDSFIYAAGQRAENSFKEHALLTRIKALFKLVARDEFMLTTYLLFTLLMFFFEFLVVIMKLTWNKTNYERKVEMIEEIGKRKMEFLIRKDTPLSDPGHFLPQLEQARIAVKKNGSLYN